MRLAPPVLDTGGHATAKLNHETGRPVTAGPVERAIRETFQPPSALGTVVKDQPFTLQAFGDDSLVLLVGPQKAYTELKWSWLEDVPGYLTGRSWVVVSAIRNSEATFGTFDDYFRKWLQRSVGSQVATLLETAGVIEVQRGTRARLRLHPEWGKRQLLA